MTGTDPRDRHGLQAILGTVRTYLTLLLEDARLNATDKLTRLFAAIALVSLLTIIGTVAMVFVTIAVAIALADVLTPLWAFVIVAGFYIVLMALILLCRRPLLEDTISRFLSRLLLDNPNQATPESHEHPSAPNQQ